MPTERFMRLPKEKDRSNSGCGGKGIYEGSLRRKYRSTGSFTTRIYREEAFTHILKINRIC